MKIGICGYGVIGTGVKKLLDNKNEFKVAKVFDRPIKKEELKELYVNNYFEITRDKDISIVVEAMGGDMLPYEIIKDALINKKHVVTSNKEVVSNHLEEFLKLSRENDVDFLYEASVGGGIPIINSLYQNSKVNEIKHIVGILNGTTNFILTKIEEGLTFEDALKEAQQKGFAESDPSADLEGLDMVRKIAILSDMAYHTFINPNLIKHRGIKGIDKKMFDLLREENKTIKFICESIFNNGEIQVVVEPVIVSKNSVLSTIRNEFNCVRIMGQTNDLLSFIGKGAGSLPTASAILSDIYLIKDNNASGEIFVDQDYKVNPLVGESYIAYDKNKNSIYEVNDVKEIKENDFYARVLRED